MLTTVRKNYETIPTIFINAPVGWRIDIAMEIKTMSKPSLSERGNGAILLCFIFNAKKAHMSFWSAVMQLRKRAISSNIQGCLGTQIYFLSDLRSRHGRRA